MSSSTNQKRYMVISIIIIGITLTMTNYILTQNKTSYFALLKSQLYDVSNLFHTKSVRVCCLILTSPKHFRTRTQAVNSTWAPRCDRFFFITEYLDINMTFEQKKFAQQIPIVPVSNYPLGYRHLTQKVSLAFLFIYLNHFNDYDWFVKTDDDTYLIVENLKHFLKEKDTSEPVTFGYHLKLFVKNGYQSGGAAYVLSREALRRFYQAHQIPDNPSCQEKSGTEDVEIARCLRNQSVYVGKSLDKQNRELFHPLTFRHHFNGLFPDWIKESAANPLQIHHQCCSDRSISFHYIKPAEQYYLDYLLYKIRLK